MRAQLQQRRDNFMHSNLRALAMFKMMYTPQDYMKAFTLQWVLTALLNTSKDCIGQTTAGISGF